MELFTACEYHSALGHTAIRTKFHGICNNITLSLPLSGGASMILVFSSIIVDAPLVQDLHRGVAFLEEKKIAEALDILTLVVERSENDVRKCAHFYLGRLALVLLIDM